MSITDNCLLQSNSKEFILDTFNIDSDFLEKPNSYFSKCLDYSGDNLYLYDGTRLHKISLDNSEQIITHNFIISDSAIYSLIMLRNGLGVLWFEDQDQYEIKKERTINFSIFNSMLELIESRKFKVSKGSRVLKEDQKFISGVLIDHERVAFNYEFGGIKIAHLNNWDNEFLKNSYISLYDENIYFTETLEDGIFSISNTIKPEFQKIIKGVLPNQFSYENMTLIFKNKNIIYIERANQRSSLENLDFNPIFKTTKSLYKLYDDQVIRFYFDH